MAKLNRSQIQERAMAVFEAHPEGIRWSELLRMVEFDARETPLNSIHGGIHNLLTTRTAEIVKVARGTYQLAKFVAADAADANPSEATDADPTRTTLDMAGSGPSEADFYAGFAEWLVENDEATVAEPLGGSSLGGKWGTPDVLGIFKPRGQDIYRFAPQSSLVKSRPLRSNRSSRLAKPSRTAYLRTRATSSCRGPRARRI